MIRFNSNLYSWTSIEKSCRRFKSDFLNVKFVRQHFLDYFSQEKHLQVRSSSVKPFSDPTLEFVNAGMNQFKNVFLGIASPSNLRIINSQKCIRIGGKHNDLNSVGHDTYHHTFFEMLGNWSFGDYFKVDACKYAWNLITLKPYSLDPGRLYVTYFGGDSKMSIPPDIETKEIWKQIGVREDRILPFGSKDNFWEMGSTGPCGPCTEIHYDHLGTLSRSNFVNTDLPNLTELWNLVFIQYNKLEDGTLIPLKQNFVDTGMGLERLVAILQGKQSNYDTDLFTPLFLRISKCSGTREYKGIFGVEDHDEIDTHYRILADHVRMITVAIADNVFPDESTGLRRVIRKSLITAEKFQPNKGLNLVFELIKVVGDILGPVYPEIMDNFKQVQYVLKNEEDLWKQVQFNLKEEWNKILSKNNHYSTLNDVRSTGLISAIKELDKMKLPLGSLIDPTFALILYDRFGLTPQVIDELAEINGYNINGRQLEIDIIKLKEKNKSQLYSLSSLNISNTLLNYIATLPKATNDKHKYLYTRDKRGQYHFNELSAQVLCLLTYEKILQKGDVLKSGTKVGVVLDNTNYWTSLKGDSDQGRICLIDKNDNAIGEIQVKNAVHYGDYVIHDGIFQSNYKDKFLLDDLNATVKIDKERRLTLMKNNMASHLLTSAIKLKYIANVQAFINTGHHFTIKYSFYGQDISEGDLLLMEHFVNIMIKEGIDISFTKIMSHELLSLNDIVVPPYFNILSDTIPLITFNCGSLIKREVTTGPVVYNSKDIDEFSLVSIELNRKKRECILKGLTGSNVHEAYICTNRLLEDLNTASIEQNDERDLEEIILKAKSLVAKDLVPMSLRVELNYLVNNLSTAIKEKHQKMKRILMEEVIAEAKQSQKSFIVHYSDQDSKLEKLTRLCQDLPIMVFAYNNGHLTCRCSVPKTCRISAEHWMTKVTKLIGGEIHYYQGHNSDYVCGMKPMKLNISLLNEIVEKAKVNAELVATELLKDNSKIETSL